MKKNKHFNKIILMAVAAGKQTQISEGGKLYTGIGVCSLLGINPTKEEASVIYNTSVDKDPEYLRTDEKGIKSVRLDFIVKLDPAFNNGIEAIKRITFFLRNEGRYNKDKTKVQVINAYGETAWLTQAEFNAKQPPAYNQDWDTKNMRASFAGEEELVGFVKRFLSIPAVSFMKADGVRENHPNPDLCQCQFGEIKKYFDGNISELKAPMMALKDNKVKVLFGVRTTDDNNTYQDIYNKMFLSINTKTVTRLEASVVDTQKAGGYSKTYFGPAPYTLKVWAPEATDIAATITSNPWNAAPAVQANPFTANFGDAPVVDDLPFN